MLRSDLGKGGWGEESMSAARGKRGLKEEWREVRPGV